MSMTEHHFPLAAVVGADSLKLALCLAASLFVVAACGALPLTRRVFS